MNYLALWREGLIVLLLALAGVQTYRLQGERAEFQAYRLEREAQDRENAVEQARAREFNIWNKRRTDEEFRAAVARAAAAGVRISPSVQPCPGTAAPAGSSNGADAYCGDRGVLLEELNRIARAGEEVAAAYRSCRVWAVGVGGSMPPETPTER